MRGAKTHSHWIGRERSLRVCFSLATLLSFLLSNHSALALDPQKAITQYVLNSWTSEDGLPQNTVTSIAQTRDGYLWFGTEDGLARFDGLTFTAFDPGNIPELKSSIILALYVDSHDNLWIGTWGGMVRFKDGKFTSFTTADGLANNIVRAFCEDKNGTLWIATDGGGLNAFKDEKFTTYTTNDGLSRNKVMTVYEDREGYLWIGTYEGTGLTRFKDGEFTTFSKKDGLTDNTVWVIHEDRDGNLWIGTSKGLNKYRDGKFTSFYTKDGLSSDSIKSVYEDTDGNLWIATFGGGLNKLKDGKFSSFTLREGLTNHIVRTIFEDKEGSLWIGTDGGGLNRLRDGKFTCFTVREGLSNDLVSTIYEDRAGNVWIGTFGGGLNRLKDGKVESFTTKDGLTSDLVIAITEDKEGSLWIGTLGGGLNRFRNGKFTPFTAKEGIPNDYVFSIIEAKQGGLWLASSNDRLKRFSEGRFTSFVVNDGMTNVYITYEDRQGALWVGTSYGLSRFWNGSFTSVIKGDGSPLDAVKAIYEDKDGSLWVLRGGVLSRLKDRNVTHFDLKSRLSNSAAFAILEDETNNFWISSHKGIFRISKNQLNDFAEGKIDSITPAVFSTEDGLKSIECSPGSPAGFRTRDGKLWFATIKGAVTIDPNKIEVNTVPPPVVIERVLIDGQEFTSRERAEVSPGGGELQFKFTGLSFVAPNKVRFKYKLEGFDKGWVDAGNSRTAHYTNIAPGKYSFRVIASNNDGLWNESGASFEFYLRPHFYQTTWFTVLIGLSLLLIGLSIHRLRVRALENRKNELESLVDGRTRELLEATRKLEEANRRRADFVSGVSHELKTPLTLIRLYGETLLYADGFSDEGRRGFYHIITRESERLTHLVDNVLDFSRIDRGVKHYSFRDGDMAALVAETVEVYTGHLRRSGFTVVVDLADDLPPVRFDAAALAEVVLNLLDNAAKYSDGNKNISVTLKSGADKVLLEIRDQGTGISNSEREKIFEQFYRGTNAAEKGGYGLGLFLVKEIMNAHGGAIEVESEPGQGSTFRMIFPCSNVAVTNSGA